MSLEMRSSSKPLPAELTAKCSNSCVELFVGFEAVGVYKAFAAVFASEGLFPGVQPFVSLEVAPLSEALPAVFAQVWLFTGVNALMVIQVRLGEEPGTALQADKVLLATMRSLMRLEDTHQREALTTCGTGERPLVTMTHHVVPQVVWQTKRLLAESAFVRFFHLVDSQVDLEEASAAETLSALLAIVRCFSTVELLLVSFEVIEVGEGLSTGSACLLIIFCIQLHFFSSVCSCKQSCFDNVRYIQSVYV